MRIALMLCGILLNTGCLGASDPTSAGVVDSPAPTGSGPPLGSPDAGAPDLARPPGGDAGGEVGPTPLTECTSRPSLDRFQDWIASGEGTTVPATGSILVKAGQGYVAKIAFVNAQWHVVPVWTANKFDGQADFSKSASFTLTYSATDDLYVQVRPASSWSGGDKWLTKIPSTGGQVQTKVVTFALQNWTTLPELGTPAYSLVDALKEVRGLVFVGKTANQIEFHGLRVDGFVPSCN